LPLDEEVKEKETSK